ncbi:MAG: citrate lyase ACP [Chlorobia bacterium]|nr:citrate lyase ACP [Fimbriimonadaceae bacterium]
MAIYLDSGGLAMTTVVGAFGDGVRGDARVTVTDGSPGLEVKSNIEAMYGRAIREQAASVICRFDNPSVHVLIEDSGALPFVLEARLEVALSLHLGQHLPKADGKLKEPIRDRLRRTRLYIPGNTPKFIVNAGLYEADGVILDLEDSVAPSEKDAARDLVRQALRTLDFGKSERLVRINSGEMGQRDIRELAAFGVELFLIPKVEDPSEIQAIDELLTNLGSGAFLLPFLESAKGIHFAYEIALASPRIIGISIGIEDYAADIHATRTEQGLESAWAHGQVVNSARAAGVSPFASVFSVIDDASQMEAYARKMSQMGFDGVGCIHPGQVKAAHRGFAPSDDETSRAQAIVDGYDKSLSEGVGAIRVDGMMIDVPIYRRAVRTLEMAASR